MLYISEYILFPSLKEIHLDNETNTNFIRLI